MGAEILGTSSNLLMAWLIALAFAVATAFASGLFPARLERARTSAFAVMILPGLVIALVYAFRGFGAIERPLVHWVFDKAAPDSLRLGLVFDPVSFAAVLFTGVATIAIGFRNRPSIRMNAALALSWAGLGLAATSQTLWTAALGIGIQLLARTLPLIEGDASPETDDARWIASAKRAWIGLLGVLAGGAGLAAKGVALDFFAPAPWTSFESSPDAIVACGLLVFGLLVMATPVFSSNALHSRAGGRVEESLFVSEAGLAWIAVIVAYRLLPNALETEWPLAIAVGAMLATAGSIAALTFQTTKENAIHLWLATFPIATLAILPFLPAREAYLYLLGGIAAFNGLWLALDHGRTKGEIAAAAAFFLGAFGLAGWPTSAGFASFFSKFEADPYLRAPVFLVLLLYAAFGWRLVVRGGDRGAGGPVHAKWIALGLFFLIGFGPAISGRWGGGSIPEETDWIEGAKAWAWVKAAAENADPSETSWLGFGVAQGLWLLSALLGILAWRSSELYPFAKKYPGGARAAEGIFGLLWLEALGARGFRRAGEFWTERVSARIWENGLPAAVGALLAGFRRAGAFAERAADPLTANGFGRLFAPAAKLVQWLHGGNVRLYAWFVLVWILIFSVYLTR